MRPKRTIKKSQPLSTTEILKELDEAVMQEEQALPVYATIFSRFFFGLGFLQRNSNVFVKVLRYYGEIQQVM